MSDISKRLDDCLSAYLRPLTYPIGIKFIKKGGPVPEKAKVPTKRLATPSLCVRLPILPAVSAGP